jgi:hypothetical protein
MAATSNELFKLRSVANLHFLSSILMDPHTHTLKRSASAVEGMEEQGSTRKLKLDPAEDLWSEDEHRRLDEEIVKACGVFPAEDLFKAGWGLGGLLSKVQDQIVTKATEIGSALVGKQPKLDSSQLLGSETVREMTTKAWREGSFKEIRNYGKCFLSFRLLYFV